MEAPSRFDKSAIRILPLGADEENLAFWLTKTPLERLEAAQQLRFPHGSARPAFLRVFKIVKLEES